MRKVTIVLFLATAISITSHVFAEVILLKSGQTVEGKLIEKTDEYIKIDFEGVPLIYFFDEVQSIDGVKQASSVQEKQSSQKNNPSSINATVENVTIETNLSVKEKYDSAVSYFLKKDYKNAFNIFGEILNDEPNPFKAIVYFNMGICLQIDGVAEKGKGNTKLSQDLFTQAAVYYQKVQAITPYFPQLYSNIGLVYFYQHKSNSEIKEMTAMGQKLTDELGAFPPDVEGAIYSYRSYEALLSIAGNYVAEGSFLDAKIILQDIVGRMEKAPPQKVYLQYTAYNSLGLCLFNLGEIKGAIHYFESSIKVAPSQPRLDVSYANLGLLYFKEHNYTKAKESVDKALEINPNNQVALDYQAKLKDAQVN